APPGPRRGCPGEAASVRRVARPTPGCPSRPGGRAQRGEAVPPRGERPKVGGRRGGRPGQALPADGVRLAGLRLRGAGGGGRRRGLRQGSVPSLAAGLLFGGLAGLGAYQQSKDPRNVWLSLVASGTLSAVMGMRFYNSRKAMPGIVAGASLLMVGRLGLQIMEKPLKP
uniref:Transmembrane protein 14C n=2 Tax=Scolopacidae TaxID=8917 RepID=A0A8C3K385_9CHAR